MFLVLHAGVPALISDAWSSSGLEQRYPLFPKADSSHLVMFEKLSRKHVSLLIKKYLAEYRIDSFFGYELEPFTTDALIKIAEASEYNAAKILRTCSAFIENALSDNKDHINKDFVLKKIESREVLIQGKETSVVYDSSATDLMKKATEK